MDHAPPLPSPFPWRAAAVLAGALALVELVALIALGLVRAAPRAHADAKAATPAPVRATVHAKPLHVPVVRSVPLRPRGKVGVLVLNGNGISGAAAMQASSLRIEGYRVAGATNAARHDYARSMVMFVPGWQKEARRLARDTRIRMVAPVDGLRPAQLRGAKLILLLGT